jgi:outer membrane protein TolC
VGLSLNLPLFSSGVRRAGLAQKRIALEQARNNKEFAARGLQVDFLQAKYDFANALEKYRSDQKNLELSRKVARITKTKYAEGISSSLELTQVNDQYLQSLSSYTASMVELLNAKIRMDILLNQI